MLYKTLSAAVYGVNASIIEVEVDDSGIKQKEDHFHSVGLPDAAVRESRDRVRAALKNCGYDIPPTDITINLAPADIRKEGSGFDAWSAPDRFSLTDFRPGKKSSTATRKCRHRVFASSARFRPIASDCSNAP
jgi:hypothetical protein